MPALHRMRCVLVLLILLADLGLALGQADEPIPHAQDRPPNPPRTPVEAIAAMTVPPGFRVELVASEPELVNPVAMTFDEKGRIWVTESLEYPRREAGPGRDRVKVLEDTDGDGRADKFTIFADGLNIPSGVAVGHGGVWVANAPDILFYPDADRDLRPDGPPQVVATGFGRHDTHELPNSLTWGPDGWLYGWNGVFNPSEVTDKHGHTYKFTCAIFRIHPRTRDFQVWCEGTSNPWGIAINENGDFFASACVIDHLWHLVETGYYIRQGGPYPPHTYPMRSIVDHQHQKAAYCGIHWFDSAVYPEKYRGKLFMGNIHGNCINVDRLERRGSTYRAEPEPDFLTANDAWFMPVSQKTGPDGCLYILDWYDRYHCYQDANRDPEGIDRLKGRLYRVRYGDAPRRVGFDLAAESDEGLIRLLGGANVYDRDTAQRLLTERLEDRTAAPGTAEALRRLVLDRSADRKARLHALWAILGTTRPESPLHSEFHADLLRDPDPTFRAWGVRAAGNQQLLPEPVPEHLAARVEDPAPEVKLQVLIALRKTVVQPAVPKIFRILHSAGEDPLITHIGWQALKWEVTDPAAVAMLEPHLNDAGVAQSLPIGRIWPRMVEVATANEDVIGPTLANVARLGLGLTDDDGPRRSVLANLAEGIREGLVTGQRLELLRKHLSPIIESAIRTPGDPLRADAAELAMAWGDPEARNIVKALAWDVHLDEPRRLELIESLLARGEHDLIAPVARAIANPRSGSSSWRRGLIEALAESNTPDIAGHLLDAYPKLEPDLRPQVIVALTGRPEWARPLLAAIAEGQVPQAAVNLNQLRRLKSMKDPEIQRGVQAIWGVVREGRDAKRDLIVGQMRNMLAKMPGDPFAGRAVFQKLCAQCHVIYGEGQEVGPDITLNGRNDFEQLVSNVFDPNLVIGPGYQATNVATRDGRILTGLLAEDSPERVVLRTQGGKVEVIPRAEIEEQRTAEVSLMPEDVESQLTPQEIADLFAFLALDKPPEDPSARRLPGAPRPKGARDDRR